MNRRGALARIGAIGVALALPATVAPAAPARAAVTWTDVTAHGVTYRALLVDSVQVFASPFVEPGQGWVVDGRVYLHPSKFALLAAEAA